MSAVSSLTDPGDPNDLVDPNDPNARSFPTVPARAP